MITVLLSFLAFDSVSNAFSLKTPFSRYVITYYAIHLLKIVYLLISSALLTFNAPCEDYIPQAFFPFCVPSKISAFSSELTHHTLCQWYSQYLNKNHNCHWCRK